MESSVEFRVEMENPGYRESDGAANGDLSTAELGASQDAMPDSPITFASMGLPTNSALQDTAMGKVRMTQLS